MKINKNKLNINVLLCKIKKENIEFDDIIVTDENHIGNIEMITFWNYCSKDYLPNLALHYFLVSYDEKSNEKMTLFIGTTITDLYGENKNNLITSFKADNIRFIKSGNYRIEAVLDEELIPGKHYDFSSLSDRAYELRSEHKIISFNKFNVIFPKDFN